MARYPSFDSTKPYEEKNEYFNELARRGEEELFSRKLHWIAERYYGKLLSVILDYEQANNKHFNKGMVFADFGISEMATGKFDAGIAHLLSADEEDRPFVQNTHGILDIRLWEQFEVPIVFGYLIRINKNTDSALDFKVDETFLNHLFREMSQQDRIFLEGTIWALTDNLYLNNVTPNVYTRGRLYSGLKDLCLLTESLIRKKQIASHIIFQASRITLGDRIGRGQRQPGLLMNALAHQNIGYPQEGINVSANDLQELVNNLEYILNNVSSVEVRRVYCLHSVRNFTGHHFDLSENIVSPTGRTFFEMYETTLNNILSAILYFKHISAI
jgi:hypothetical protein